MARTLRVLLVALAAGSAIAVGCGGNDEPDEQRPAPIGTETSAQDGGPGAGAEQEAAEQAASNCELEATEVLEQLSALAQARAVDPRAEREIERTVEAAESTIVDACGEADSATLEEPVDAALIERAVRRACGAAARLALNRAEARDRCVEQAYGRAP